MGNQEDEEIFTEKARKIVFKEVEGVIDTTFDKVRVVWFSKTLQNWKAIVAILEPNGYLFEVTYNGKKKETYIDSYRKYDNVRIRDMESN